MLDSEQERLLSALVEASRAIPRQQRQKFMYIKFLGGYRLQHPGIRSDFSFTESDLEELERQGLLGIDRLPSGTWWIDIFQPGYEYYDALQRAAGKATDRVEHKTRSFVDSDEFRQEYPVAYQKWMDAEERLWSDQPGFELTTVGHLCREAMQEYVDVLVLKFRPPSVESQKARTINRLRTVLGHVVPHPSQSVEAFLSALIAYWKSVDDLVQRQEHGAQKEGESLNFEDARRVVFQTMIVMYEVHKAICSQKSN
jgi:hypothetical protein